MSSFIDFIVTIALIHICLYSIRHLLIFSVDIQYSSGPSGVMLLKYTMLGKGKRILKYYECKEDPKATFGTFCTFFYITGKANWIAWGQRWVWHLSRDSSDLSAFGFPSHLIFFIPNLVTSDLMQLFLLILNIYIKKVDSVFTLF